MQQQAADRLPRTVCLAVAACFFGGPTMGACGANGLWQKKKNRGKKVNKKPKDRQEGTGDEARTVSVSWWV